MSMTDSDKTSTKKYKEKDIPELYLLRDADKATYLDPAEAEADKTSTETKRAEIPVLFPNDQGSLEGGHYFSDKEDVVADKAKELMEDLAFGEESENTNLMTSLVPFADVGIKLSEGKRPGLLDVGLGVGELAGALKGGKKVASMLEGVNKPLKNKAGYVWLDQPDRDALQRAEIMEFANRYDKNLKTANTNTADRVMELSPKARDELTTMAKKHREDWDGYNDAVTYGRSSDGEYNTKGAGDNRKLAGEINLGAKHPNNTFYDKGTAPHEMYHMYDEFAGKHLPEVQTEKTIDGGKYKMYNLSYPSLSARDGSKIRGMYNKLPAVQRVKARLKNVDPTTISQKDLRMEIAKEVINDDYLRRYSDDEISCISDVLADMMELEPKKAGGLFQSDDLVRVNGNNKLGHDADYAKEMAPWMEGDADVMEAGAEMNEIGSLTRWLEEQGIKNEDLYPFHIPYDKAEELAEAEYLRKSPFYDANYKLPTYKMNVGGTKFNKLLESEADYLEANGVHSPKWNKVIDEQMVGDRHGPLNEKDLQYHLDKWRNEHYGRPMPTRGNPNGGIPLKADKWEDMDDATKKSYLEGVLDFSGLSQEETNRLVNRLTGISESTLMSLRNLPSDLQRTTFSMLLHNNI